MKCSKCLSTASGLFLIFGIVFLVKNLTSWNFWGIEWYTVFFIVLGMSLGSWQRCASCTTDVKIKKK